MQCGCTGPREGEPVCPCQMKDVRVLDGRYVRTVDLGPAPNGGMPKSFYPQNSRVFGKPDKWDMPEGTRILDKVTGYDLGRAD
jgi:hypothetical protein